MPSMHIEDAGRDDKSSRYGLVLVDGATDVWGA
jgi:hypothetical protein